MAPQGKLDYDSIQRLIDQQRFNSARTGFGLDQSDDLLGGSEGQRRANSSLVRGLFDLLARPSRASAGAVRSLVDEDPETDFISGLLGGLTGKTKNTYSDVLGDLGVENRYAKSIGGFAGDVLLDPLTYTGIKSVKGVGPAEARMKAVKKLSELGEETTEDSVERVVRELEANDPSHLYVTFAGKKITPSVEAPSKGARTLKDLAVGPEENRRGVAKFFSRRSELPFGLADKARIYESQNSGLFGRHRDAVRDFFKDLTPDERRRITYAIEDDVDLSSLEVNAKAHREGLNTLEDYRQVAKKLFKRYFDDEAALGLYKPEQYQENYVYKFFRKGIPEEKPGLPPSIATRSSGDKSLLTIMEAAQKSGVGPSETLGRAMAAGSPRALKIQDAKALGFDPLDDISDVLAERSAKHYRTIGRQAFVRDAIEQFGIKPGKFNEDYLIKNGFRPAGTSLHAPVKDAEDLSKLWIPDAVARAINGTETVLRDGQLGAEFTRWYDKIIGGWKSLNTMWNPGYHVRNSMSDGLINFMDGVTNPSLYNRAWRVIGGAKQTEAGDILGISEPLDEALRKVRVGPNQLTADDVWNLYLRGGSKSGYITSDLVDPLVQEGVGKAVGRADTLRQAARGKVGDWSDKREDFFRLAHHIKAMEDNLPKNRAATREELEKATVEAGKSVRKYNIDYGMLSTGEKNIARRIIPFYGWMRRNLPLQVELMFTKPGYMAAYPKGQDLLQGLLGSDNGEGDYLIPKWIRDSAPVRVALAENEKNTALGKAMKFLAGAKQGESVFTPILSSQTPVGDLETLLDPIANVVETGDPKTGIIGQGSASHKLVNMLTPALRAPTELATGRSLFTGQKVDDSPGGWSKWLMNQVGPTRVGSNIAEGNVHNVTSWGLGLGLQPVSPERQHSEFKRREDIVDQKLREEKFKALADVGFTDRNAITERQLQRIRNPEIIRLQRYKQNTMKILGAIGVET